MFHRYQQAAPWCQLDVQPGVPYALQQQQHSFDLQQQKEEQMQQDEQVPESPREDALVSEEARVGMYALILRSIESASEACGRTQADVHRYATKIEVGRLVANIVIDAASHCAQYGKIKASCSWLEPRSLARRRLHFVSELDMSHLCLAIGVLVCLLTCHGTLSSLCGEQVLTFVL